MKKNNAVLYYLVNNWKWSIVSPFSIFRKCGLNFGHREVWLSVRNFYGLHISVPYSGKYDRWQNTLKENVIINKA